MSLAFYAAQHQRESAQDFAAIRENAARACIDKSDNLTDTAAMLHALTMRIGTANLLGPELAAILAARIALEDAAAALRQDACKLRSG